MLDTGRAPFVSRSRPRDSTVLLSRRWEALGRRVDSESGEAMTDAPRWRQLHEQWYAEQRQRQPGDVEAAWDALFEVLLVSWTTSRPSFDSGSRQWYTSAIRSPKTSRGPLVVPAAGPTEPASSSHGAWS